MILPEELVFEILLRLPVRSLLRFRCVCKEWCAMIKSCRFKDKHLALRNAKADSMGDDVLVFKKTSVGDVPNRIYKAFASCCNGDYESLALSVSAAASANDYFEILGNCSDPMTIINHVNGVVCVAGKYSFEIILFNPSIREVRKLPVPDLGFSCHIQGFGFGFDAVTNEYKVVGIVSRFEKEGSYVKQLSLLYRVNTNTWTILSEMPAFVSEYYSSMRCFLGWDYGPRPCIFSHGSIHWLVEGKNRILTFNVTTELFQEIHLPHGWNDYGYLFDFRLYLFERSDLALVGFKVIPQCDGNNFLTKPLVDIWVMKEYGVTESWTKQYSVTSLSEIGLPLPFRGKDKLFITMLDGELICYDLSKGEVYQPLNQSVYLRRVDVIACIESLVSVK